MRSVPAKKAPLTVACLLTLAGWHLGACSSQPAPRTSEAHDATALAQAQQRTPSGHAEAEAAPAAAPAEHASCGGQSDGQGCGCGAQAPAEGAAQTGAPSACCGGSACGSGEDHGGSCGSTEQAAAQPAAARDQGAPVEMQLTRVTDPSQICMVRNHYMGRPQLSVSTDSGTYYGCCAGCANRLLQDPGARVAIDPVNHHPVDKALAVLAKTPRGNVLYFESEQTLSAFSAGL